MVFQQLELEKAILRDFPKVSVDLIRADLRTSTDFSCAGYALVFDQEQLLGVITARDLRYICAAQCMRELVKPIPTLNQAEFIDFTMGLALFQDPNLTHVALTNDQEQVVGILTPASLLQALQMIIQRERLIASILVQMRESRSLQDIFQAVVTGIRDLLSCDRVILYQFQPDRTGLVVAESVLPGWTTCLDRKIVDTCFEFGMAEDYLHRRMRSITNIYEAGLSPCHIRLLEGFEVKANLILPIVIVDPQVIFRTSDPTKGLWGLLIAYQCDAPRVWQDSEIALLNQLGIQVELTIQQANSYQRAQDEIRERQQTEHILRASEQRYREIVETALEGIWIYDAESVTTFVNPRMAAMLGYRVDEMIGQSIFHTLTPEGKILAQARVELRKQGFAAQYDLELITKAGQEIWVLVSSIPLRDEQGQYSGALAMLTDITERKRAELAMQNLVKGTATVTGQDFFPALVRHLAESLEVCHALIAELRPDHHLQTRAFWSNDQLQPSFRYEPQGTPCQQALEKGEFCCPAQVQQGFPEDLALVNMQAESYMGIVLKDANDQPIGALCILDNKPLTNIDYLLDILRVFGARAAAELDRARATEALETMNVVLESLVEQRTRDLQTSESKLARNEKQLDEYLRQSLIGLSITSPTGQWLEANEYLLELLGYSREELLRLSWKELTHTDDLAENLVLFNQALNNEIDYYLMDKRFICKNGAIIFTSVSTRCMRYSDGTPDYFLTLVQDITKRKQAKAELLATNQKLSQINQALEAATRLKDDFLSTVSHELRTPLNNMNAAITLLKRNPEAIRRDFYIQTLADECKRERDLINDLLDLQRLEAGQRSFIADPIDLHKWLPRVISPFLERFAQRGQDFHKAINPEGLTLISDRSSLERILSELLNNACKYAPPDHGLICLTAQGTSKGVQFRISNDGPCIPTDALPHIFEKFYRAPTADRWQQGGTGLGLALVKGLVEELGGEIVVVSNEQQTDFILFLPNIPCPERV